ncbi:LPS assembly lipoprotein LptE [Tolumonas lignilytica]|uniref:LPS-assembly lipoprotein LptE n=1 Tax=Tolumonas lignilytica TaxID=1283284 RepID=UPI0004648FA2|nr:LPS assembly lipoprotein LptE [Tolumonas lignilytica]
MKRQVWSLIILVSFLLTGCGFQMRGSDKANTKLLPEQLKAIHIEGDDRSDIYRMVSARLRHYGVRLVDRSDDVMELDLGNITVSNSAASLDNRSQVVEYVMLFNTNYSITMPHKPLQKFSARFSRVFLNKSAQALASSREQAQLRHEMEIQTADLILVQLGRVVY